VSGVARYVKFTAQTGRAEELARLLLGAAESLNATNGCELYLVNRSTSDPNQVWVTELWLDQASLDAALERLRTTEGETRLAEVRALLDPDTPPERVELEPLGGVGYLAGGSGYACVNLEDVEDMAPRFGLGEQSEARFATRPLGAARTGLSHQRLRPGVRQAFGHRHRHAEEVVLILSGSGRVKIDDEIVPISPLDAIRFAPGTTRAFEAGPEGLEFVVFGPHLRGDAVMDKDFWPTETEPQ
jgi:quinol monooxygenase YgiN/mannose-6-phosphate isomerase-like protein (cupin superfamily)